MDRLHFSNMTIYAVILFLIEFVRGGFLISFLPAYGEQQLGLSAAGVGIAVSVHYLTDTVIKCFAGYLLDRFSLRFVGPIGLAISLGGLLLMLQARQLWLLAGAAALFGVGISPVWLGGLSRVQSGHRAEGMGVIYTCWLAGLGLGPVVLNFLLDRGYFLSFWLMTGLWGAALCLSLFIPRQMTDLKLNPIPVVRQISLLWERLRSMKLLVPGMILQTAAAGMLVPVLPGFASSQLGLNYSQYSLVLIAGGGLTMLSLVPMGKLSDRFGGKRYFIIGGFAVFAASLFVLSFASTLRLAILIAAVLGVSYGAVLPSWNALLARYVPQGQKGLGWGLFSSVEGIGVMIGPILGGWIADFYQPRTAVWMSAVLLASIAVYYLIVTAVAGKEKLGA